MKTEECNYSEIGERVKQIRNSLKLSQELFASELGASRDSINNLEHARTKNIPFALLNLICSQYNVDKDWMLYGEGEMKHEAPKELVDQIAEILKGENELAKSVFKAFASFGEDDWKTVEKFIDSLKK